ncbi:MAG: acetyl-CoA C-acetyltransferase [Candidatus Eisenbacteria bacterium]|uniref:Acetyl-CoA C-acetyltransferase n=1 Tax=Eiseniibacteriota bacterium TaxID=2212470 RepID=A0A538TAU1_UNCEI|nr:MAG: acetyl-CoA C-acetyltransferase [Candidatus Eisenbacteria bacterium]
MADRDAYIVSACRTAIGEFLGGLSPLRAPELGAVVIREAVSRAGIEPALAEEVLMGNVVQAGVGQAPARQAAIRGGIPDSVGATTVNKVCGSGLKAVMLASQAIRAGDADIIVAGGMESMSNAPYLLPKARVGYRLGNGELIDDVIYDGLWDSFNNFHMGNAAELIARKFKVTREDQDRFSVESHQKAVRAQKEGKFKDEIVPVLVPQKKGEPKCFCVDERPRPDTTMESLAKLKPAFEKDGTVTAANAPGLNDGASAVVVMSGAAVKRTHAKPMARVTGYATGGVAPEMVFYAPVVAVKRLAEKLGRKPNDWDLIEANEAFAAQAIVDARELDWDFSKLNVHGGAVALGHPIGASGARVLTTLLYAMRDRKAKTGLATLCLGGGNAVALSVEAV